MISFNLDFTNYRAFGRFLGAVVVLLKIGTMASAAGGSSGDALYFSFQVNSPLPASPSSLLIQSPSYISVPAGSLLSVYLLKGDTLVSTSTLSFQQAFESERLIPPVPVASFVPPGSSTGAGQPLPGATLTAGVADLTKLAPDPSSYRLLWILTTGIMGTPGRAIATGSPVSFVDLKLSAISAAATLGDQKPGSILFFNRYTSNASNTLREDSKLNLTNTNVASSAFVRLFLVNAATCEISDLEVCLSPQQTLSLQMSDIDPGVRGYIVAVAVNAQGEPIQFNWLTGNILVKQPAGNIGGSFTSVLSAVAVAKRKDGAVPNNNGLAEMLFDDVNYDRLPGQISFDSVPSQSNQSNSTIVSFFRPVSNLSGGTANMSVQLSAWGKNDQNQVITSNGTASVACYSDFAVSTLRLTPITVAQLLPAGSTGWFAASSADTLPLLGAQLNSGEFNSGINARALSFSTEYKIRVPVSPVACSQ